MRAPFSMRRGAALYLCVCLGIGLALGGVVVVVERTDWSNALLFALPVTLVYGVASGYSAYYLCRAYQLSGRHPAAVLGVMSSAAVLASIAWSALVQAWNALTRLPALPWAGVALTPSLSLLMFGLGVLLYGLAVVVFYLLIEFVRASAAEQRELESQLMAQEAELRMLRTQIDPHFLFNSLNSISALTAFNPAGARDMTLQLASFFRQSLGMEANKKVTLGEELILIRHFLAIEQVRFGARLLVREHIEEAALECMVPPMIIQPLVENAVKHGICNLTEGGTIGIVVRCRGSVLEISVVNPVDAQMPAANGNGIGLNNVRQRLAGAYKHEASIHWGRQQDSFGVELRMPVEIKED